MMTHDEMIAVIAAHRDGKKIQRRRRRLEGAAWSGVVGPVWNFDEYEYRAEPEPFEAWAVVLSDGDFFTYSKKNHAEAAAIKYKNSRIIRMIETEEGGEA